MEKVTEKNWYVIYTKSKFEKKLYQALQKIGYTAFLPLVKKKKRWSDRIKVMEEPLLPSYVFTQISKSAFAQIYSLPGFVRFVRFEGKAAILQAKEIELLQDIVRSGVKAQTSDNCKVGDQIRIVRGPLEGWQGKVSRTSGDSKVVFYFEGIQQAISVEVEVSDLEKINLA